MTGVTLTSAMRANLLSLQQTANLLGTTQFRLATGNKVNSALDNPSSYFAAQGLNDRASDLSALLDGMGQSIQTLKAADQAITSMTTMLQSAKAVAQTAKTQAAGAASVTGTHSLTPADSADLVGSAGIGAGIATGDELGITLNAETRVDIAITTGDTIADLINNINGDATLDGRVKAELVANTAAGHAGEFFLKISTTDGSALTLGGGTNDVTADLGLSTSQVGSTTDYSAAISQFNDLRTQFDALVNDAGYRGINLLNGNHLVTQFNETNTSSSDVSSAQDFSMSGLGVSAAAWTGTAGIDASIASIDTAITTMKDEASKFGNALTIIQNRQDYTTNLVNVLKDGASALTLADKNEEGANLLALQTSQQLGIQALSLSSQANQSVLRLFS